MSLPLAVTEEASSLTGEWWMRFIVDSGRPLCYLVFVFAEHLLLRHSTEQQQTAHPSHTHYNDFNNTNIIMLNQSIVTNLILWRKST